MQTDIFEYLYPRFKIDKPIRLIELFAGIGSQAKALERIGADFEHYKVVEFDKYAIKSYNAIHSTNFETSDITQIHASDLDICETDKYTYILTYSFPCQDLSKAGKKKGMEKGSGTRSGLLWEVERILDECDELPQVLLMENVPDVIGEKNIHDFKQWHLKLEQLGYTNYIKVMNAKDYGIPQNRSRCFMVSIQGNYFYEFPKPFKLSLRLKDMLQDEVDEKYYINDGVLNNIKSKNQAGFLSGGKWDKINESSRRYYDVNKTSPTIHTCQGGNTETKILVHEDRIRKLIPLECYRLMGFDDEDFYRAERVNSNTQLYKQAGNSIVVNVLEQIFKMMF